MSLERWFLATAIFIALVCLGGIGFMAYAAPAEGAHALKPKIFSGPTDGNQAPKLERKIMDWLTLNEKTIEVVNQTQSNRGMDTVITIWYRGSAKEAAKPGTPTPGLHNLPGDPLPLDKESRGQKPGLDIPEKK